MNKPRKRNRKTKETQERGKKRRKNPSGPGSPLKGSKEEEKIRTYAARYASVAIAYYDQRICPV